MWVDVDGCTRLSIDVVEKMDEFVQFCVGDFPLDEGAVNLVNTRSGYSAIKLLVRQLRPPKHCSYSSFYNETTSNKIFRGI